MSSRSGLLNGNALLASRLIKKEKRPSIATLLKRWDIKNMGQTAGRSRTVLVGTLTKFRIFFLESSDRPSPTKKTHQKLQRHFRPSKLRAALVSRSTLVRVFVRVVCRQVGGGGGAAE